MRGIGRHTHTMEHTPSDLDVEIRKRLNGEPSEELSPEEIRADYRERVREEMGKQESAQAQADGDALVKLFPQYKDTTKNAQQICAFCLAVYGTAHPNIDQMAHAFHALSANNLLDLDQRVLAKQADEAAAVRAEQFKAEASMTEEEMEALPMSDLKVRANAALAKHTVKRF